MIHRRTAAASFVILVVLGAACIFARFAVWRNPLSVRPGKAWRVTCDIEIEAPTEGARINIGLPDSTPQARIIRESFTHPGFATDIVRGRRTRGREATAVALRRGTYLRFSAEFDVLVNTADLATGKPPVETLPAESRAYWLRSERDIQVTNRAVIKALEGLSQASSTKGQTLERIFQYCSESITASEGSKNSDAAGALADKVANPLGLARAMVALCRVARMPARLVVGFDLSGGAVARHVWVEVYDKKQWYPYDPHNGFARELPPTYMPARRDAAQIVRISGAPNYRVRYGAWRIQPFPGTIGRSQRSAFDFADLTRLPWAMQQTLALILLLPIGAIITAVFRNFVGIETFGTFTPSLLALSLVHANWLTGLTIFAIVLSIGLGGRVFLNWLKLLAVPRLGLVLTLVVLILTLGVSLLYSLGMTPTAHSVLLPMVIMTMVIERFHVNAEEDSLANALLLLAGTLVVGACCFLVLRWEALGLLLLAMPEVHLFTAAGLILIGRYQGYRLLELWRFRDMARPTGRKD